MAKSASLDNQILKLLFQGVGIPNIADNTATAPLTTLYGSLHTGDPTAAGTQSSNEIAYTGYARVAITRSTGAWTVTGNSVSPAATISFPPGTGGTGTATFFAIGEASSGANEYLYAGAISPTITVGNGITPQLTTGTTIQES